MMFVNKLKDRLIIEVYKIRDNLTLRVDLITK